MQSPVAGDNRIAGAAKVPVSQRLAALACREVGGAFPVWLDPSRISQARALAFLPNQRPIYQSGK